MALARSIAGLMRGMVVGAAVEDSDVHLLKAGCVADG
jgi:hypothetical protein